MDKKIICQGSSFSKGLKGGVGNFFETCFLCQKSVKKQPNTEESFLGAKKLIVNYLCANFRIKKRTHFGSLKYTHFLGKKNLKKNNFFFKNEFSALKNRKISQNTEGGVLRFERHRNH